MITAHVIHASEAYVNIFILSRDPAEAATFQCDKHVPKMLLESAQLLSTAVQLHGTRHDKLYKISHVNHPCTRWVAESPDNFIWLYRHALNLSFEYSARFGKSHKSAEQLWLIRSLHLGPVLTINEPKKFVLAMPDKYKQEDPVEAYRAYYRSKTFAKWAKGREQPYWWRQP